MVLDKGCVQNSAAIDLQWSLMSLYFFCQPDRVLSGDKDVWSGVHAKAVNLYFVEQRHPTKSI